MNSVQAWNFIKYDDSYGDISCVYQLTGNGSSQRARDLIESFWKVSVKSLELYKIKGTAILEKNNVTQLKMYFQDTKELFKIIGKIKSPIATLISLKHQ